MQKITKIQLGIVIVGGIILALVFYISDSVSPDDLYQESSDLTEDSVTTSNYDELQKEVEKLKELPLPNFDYDSIRKNTEPLEPEKYGFRYGDGKIYRSLREVKVSDPESFVPLRSFIGKDSINVYYFSGDYDGHPVLEGADPETFELLEGYGMDKDQVWFFGSPQIFFGQEKEDLVGPGILEGVSPDDFEVTELGFGSDGENLYLGGYLMDGLDPETTIRLNDRYLADEDTVYYMWGGHFYIVMKLEGVNVSELKFDEMIAYDDEHIYVQGTLLEGVSPDPFISLNNYYKRAGEHILYQPFACHDSGPAFIVSGADGLIFETLSGDKWSIYGKDNEAGYYMGRIIPDSDPNNIIVGEDGKVYGLPASFYEGKPDRLLMVNQEPC